MGSFQQISLGMVCLVAAFAFGNYVNNHPHIDSTTSITGTDSITETNADGLSGKVLSRLQDTDLAHLNLVEKRPAAIATMRNPVTPRFTLPSRTPSNDSFTAQNGLNKQLPPPSELPSDTNANSSQRPAKQIPLARIPALNSDQKNHKFTGTNLGVQIPDFSAIAAKLKSNAHTQFPSGAIGNTQTPRQPANATPLGQLEFDNANQNSPVHELAKQFAAETNPTPSINVPPNPETADAKRWNVPTESDFDNRRVQYESRPFSDALDSTMSETLSLIRPSRTDFAAAKPPIPELAIDNPTSPNSVLVSESPIYQPAVESNYRGPINTEQTNGSSMYGTLTPQPIAPTTSQPSNRVRTLLPFGLTDQAKNNLAQIRTRVRSNMKRETTEFVDHVIQQNESLQSISLRYFGTPDYYLDIYLANRNKLRNPVDIPIGITLQVPIYK